MKTTNALKVGLAIAVTVLLFQAANTFFRQRDGYFECVRPTSPVAEAAAAPAENPTYYFEFHRSFFTFDGKCPRTGAFDASAVRVGTAGIDECDRLFELVRSQGLVCAKVHAPSVNGLGK